MDMEAGRQLFPKRKAEDEILGPVYKFQRTGTFSVPNGPCGYGDRCSVPETQAHLPCQECGVSFHACCVGQHSAEFAGEGCPFCKGDDNAIAAVEAAGGRDAFQKMLEARSERYGGWLASLPAAQVVDGGVLSSDDDNACGEAHNATDASMDATILRTEAEDSDEDFTDMTGPSPRKRLILEDAAAALQSDDVAAAALEEEAVKAGVLQAGARAKAAAVEVIGAASTVYKNLRVAVPDPVKLRPQEAAQWAATRRQQAATLEQALQDAVTAALEAVYVYDAAYDKLIADARSTGALHGPDPVDDSSRRYAVRRLHAVLGGASVHFTAEAFNIPRLQAWEESCVHFGSIKDTHFKQAKVKQEQEMKRAMELEARKVALARMADEEAWLEAELLNKQAQRAALAHSLGGA
jgi:hypothetical protein